NFPLNGAKHMLHSEPKVAVGDKVRRGQLLADSNFTKGGKLALGTNLRVAYIPYRGYNFEDGVVISESAAQKLISSHLHSAEAEMHPNVVVNKKMWRQYAGPVKATPEILQKLDDDGVIRVGQKVEPGDVLIAKLQKQVMSKDTEDIRRRLKGAIQDYTDAGVRWDHDCACRHRDCLQPARGRPTTIPNADRPADVDPESCVRHRPVGHHHRRGQDPWARGRRTGGRPFVPQYGARP
ncbi:MAG: hypothetical protein EBS89_08130, partial [Proteobacteria bacterium]|nr:hypothetical protein [Pseudomonadota bacterium]